MILTLWKLTRTGCVYFLLFTLSSCHAVEPIQAPAHTVKFELPARHRVSLAIYSPDGLTQLRVLLQGEWLSAGSHELTWDGLDRAGQPMPAGKYLWKLIYHPGLQVDYLTALGVNPKAGGWTRWPGNHAGPSCIAVSPQAIAVGSSTAEGPPRLMVFEPDLTTERWYTPHFGWSHLGPVAMGINQQVVVYLQQDAKVLVHDVHTGELRTTIDTLWPGDPRLSTNDAGQMDLDADAASFLVSYEQHDTVRWYDPSTGKVLREHAIAKPTRVVAAEKGAAYVLSEGAVKHLSAEGVVTLIVPAQALVNPVALTYDQTSSTLLIANAEPEQQILRFNLQGREVARYGQPGGRKPGPYHADCFGEVVDLTADGQGGFFVVEGAYPHRSQGSHHSLLRRVARVDAQGQIIDEWFGPTTFFNVASAVPGQPTEVYHNLTDHTLARYQLHLTTGQWHITHLLQLPEHGLGDGLFPRATAFPFYRPLLHRGKLYLHSQGRFLVRPDLANGRLIPVALATFRPYNGWPQGIVPKPVQAAADHFQLDINSAQTDAFTWSDANANGELDPQEFRFATTGPGAGYAALDADLNLYFGHYAAPNHTYTGKHWIMWDFESSLYAKLPNLTPQLDIPTWDWPTVQRSALKIPADPLGRDKRWTPQAVHVDPDGSRLSVFARSGGGALADLHPMPWPAVGHAQVGLLLAQGDRLLALAGKKRSLGPPLDAQFSAPSHLLGRVDDNLIVCDRMFWTTAYTPDGLYIGKLLERPVDDELPHVHYTPFGYDGVPTILSGDDWMAAGSITDLGDGQALWFAPSGNRAMVFKVRGWRDLKRLQGWLTLDSTPTPAAFDGSGLSAEYFDNPSLTGNPVARQLDPRLWFAHGLSGGQIVRDWAKGPHDAIPQGNPFSVRWSGSLTAPFTEPFWFRVANFAPTQGLSAHVQTWDPAQGYARVWLNDQLIIDKWIDSPRGNLPLVGPIPLQAGQTYNLRVEYITPHPTDIDPSEVSLTPSPKSRTTQTPAADPRVQFSLSWCSYTYEWMRVPTQLLHPHAAAQPAKLAWTPARTPSPDPDMFLHYTFDQVNLPTDREILPEDHVVHDHSGHGNHGHIQSYMHPWVRTVPSLPSFGSALYFPTGRERIYITTEDSPPDFTISLWFKTTQPNAAIAAIGGVNLYLKQGALAASFSGWPLQSPETSPAADGHWHHLAYTYRQSDRMQALYLDGQLLAQRTGPGNASFASRSVLGSAHNLGHFATGTLDQLKLFPRSLEPEEISALSQETSVPRNHVP